MEVCTRVDRTLWLVLALLGRIGREVPQPRAELTVTSYFFALAFRVLSATAIICLWSSVILLLVGVAALRPQRRKHHCLSPSRRSCIDHGSLLCFSDSGFESSYDKNGDDIPLHHSSSLTCNVVALLLLGRIQGHTRTYPRYVG